jgi:hypothetical protein
MSAATGQCGYIWTGKEWVDAPSYDPAIHGVYSQPAPQTDEELERRVDVLAVEIRDLRLQLEGKRVEFFDIVAEQAHRRNRR